MKKADFFDFYAEQHKNDMTPATPAAVPEEVAAQDPVEVTAAEAAPATVAPETVPAPAEVPAEGGVSDGAKNE